MRFEVRTNRNIFNYNLESDQEFSYLEIEKTGYQFTLLNENSQPLMANSFYRKNKNYDGFKLVALNIHSLHIIQNLEQKAFQQKN